MNTAVTLSNQREALYTLVTVLDLKCGVEKYPRDDAVPPVVIIGNPSITFNTPQMGLVEWPIQFLQPRAAPAATSAEFDEKIPQLCLMLRRGAEVGYVLGRVEPRVVDVQGYPLAGYTIFGTAPLPNC